jgi:hypothetical protein
MICVGVLYKVCARRWDIGIVLGAGQGVSLNVSDNFTYMGKCIPESGKNFPIQGSGTRGQGSGIRAQGEETILFCDLNTGFWLLTTLLSPYAFPWSLQLSALSFPLSLTPYALCHSATSNTRHEHGLVQSDLPL